MKATELIEELKKAISEHGDCEVKNSYSDFEDNHFSVDGIEVMIEIDGSSVIRTFLI